MKLGYTEAPKGINYRLYQFASRRIAQSFETYHPVSLQGNIIQQGQRSCEDRWCLISQVLGQGQAKSFLDLGCAEGYFVRHAAQEFGCFSVGVDGDFKRLLVAQNCAMIDNVIGTSFVLSNIDSEFIEKLPVFDVVVFLSVMHHIMYEHGVDYSRSMLRAIREKTKQCMIFDMGQSNEIKNAWAKLLPNMGDDPSAWIADFLRSAGFNSVDKVGEADSYQNEARRAVFLAKP